MIAPPPVWGLLHSPRRWWIAIAAYVIATLAGALVLGAVLALAGSVLNLPVYLTAGLAFLLALTALVLDVRSLPQGRWRVPRWQAFGHVRYALVFGFVLGVAVFTALPAVSFYFLIIYALTGGSTLTLILFGAFGAARVLPLLVAARHATRSGEYPVTITDRLGRAAVALRPVEVVLLVATGVALLATRA